MSSELQIIALVISSSFSYCEEMAASGPRMTKAFLLRWSSSGGTTPTRARRMSERRCPGRRSWWRGMANKNSRRSRSRYG